MSADLIVEWNAFMTNKINDNDLKCSSEPFFRNCLLSILKRINVATTQYEITDPADREHVRMARIKLCYVVDHFLKISAPKGPKYQFVYMDLVYPNPRKMVSVLRYLLNYAQFYRMVKSETVDVANAQLTQLDQLKTEKNDCQKEIERAKMNEEIYKKSIKELKHKIPRSQNQIKELGEKEYKLKEEIGRIESEFQSLELQSLTTKSELNDLQRLVVSETEAKSIIERKQQFEQQLEEYDHIIATARKKSCENSEVIKELNGTVDLIEKVLKAFKIDTTELRERKKYLEDLQKTVQQLQKNVEDNQQKLKSLELATEALSKEMQENREKFEKNKKSHEKELKTVKSMTKEKKEILNKLTAAQKELMENNGKVKQEGELIYEMYSKTFVYISNC